MSASRKYDPKNELFVRREDFDRVFSKAVPKATFHRWVKDGKIKKARDLDGWYLLNKTLVHQGMAPVDIKEFKQERESTPTGLKNSQLLYLAVLQSDAAFEALAPPRFKLPTTLTPEEVAKVRKLMGEHEKVMSFYQERSQRVIYQHGFLDALDFAAFVDGD
ncbi:MAG: hypothetical protein ACQKBV_07015 [Puniceicoccales bacterium]